MATTTIQTTQNHLDTSIQDPMQTALHNKRKEMGGGFLSAMPLVPRYIRPYLDALINLN